MANMNVVAHPYAQALFNLAKKSQSENQWLQVLADLAALTENAQFRQALSNPKVTSEQIISVVKSCLAKDASAEVINLLQVLAENDRILALAEIHALFRDMILEDQKRSDAVIETAYELSKAEKQELERILSKKFGKEITAIVTVNPDLLAGIKITVNDKVIDGSVKGRLNALATQLTK